MANPSKDIGTKCETWIARVAQVNGFPGADRKTQRGEDVADVWLCPGIVVQSKGGEAARAASPKLITAWWAKTLEQAANARADHALLVVQRRGYGYPRCEMWRAFMSVRTVRALTWHWAVPPLAPEYADDFLMETTYLAALRMLRAGGYGDPISAEVPA